MDYISKLNERLKVNTNNKNEIDSSGESDFEKKLRKIIEERDNSFSKINSDYIKSFFGDADNFLNSAATDSKDIGFKNASSLYTTKQSTWSNLQKTADNIRAYYNVNKDKFDEETYYGVIAALNDFDRASRQSLEYYKSYADFFSNYKTEDDYNEAVETQKKHDHQIAMDLKLEKSNIDSMDAFAKSWDDKKKELVALESSNMAVLSREEYADLYFSEGFNSREEAEAAYDNYLSKKESLSTELQEYKKQYGSYEDYNAEVAKKRAYYNEAEVLQKNKQMASVTEKEDFEEKSKPMGSQIKKWGFNPYTTYDYINDINGYRATSDAQGLRMGKGDGEEAEYAYMTDEEIGIYNYYYATEGQEKADEYLETLTPTLNARLGNKMYGNVEGDTFAEIIFSGVAGLDQFASGMKNLGNYITGEESYIAPSAIQMASSMVREDLKDDGFLAQMAYDLGTTTANMLPSILVSAIPVVGQAAGAVTLGASAIGNSYAEMINLGYNKDQARGYSTLVGVSEAGLQYLLGGVSKLGGKLTGNAASKLLSGIDNAFARVAINTGTSMLGEFTEEGLQTILEPWFKSIATNTNYEAANLGDVLYSGLLGALSAGVLENINTGSTDTVAGAINTAIQGNKINKAGATRDLVNLGNTMSADSVAYELAGKINEKTGAYTIGRLLHESGAALTESNIADISAKLQSKGIAPENAQSIAKWLNNAVNGKTLTRSQQKALENNPVITEVLREVTIDQNTTVYQRMLSYQKLSEVATEMASKQAKTTATKDTPAKADKTAEVDKTTEATSSNVIEDYAKSEAEIRQKAEAIAEITGISVEEATKIAKKQVQNTKADKSSSEDEKAIESTSNKLYEASDDGKTRLIDSGEEVSIKEIVTITQGNMMLKLDNGKTVNAKDVAFADDIAPIYETVARMEGINGVIGNSLIRNFDAKDGVSAEQYALGIEEAFRYGRYNFSKEEMSTKGFAAILSEAQRNHAYNMGRSARNESIRKGEDFKGKNKGADRKEKGELIFEGVDRLALSERNQASLAYVEIIAKILGKDIHIFQSTRDAQGRLSSVDRYGKRQSANGLYYREDGAIYVDIRAGINGDGLAIYTAAHELTHFIRQWSPEKFNILADFLVEEYGKKGTDVNTLVLDRQKKSGLSYDVAFEEVVADSMEAMLADGRVAEKIAKLKEKDESIVKQLLKGIKKLIVRVTKAYEGLPPESREAKEVAEMSIETFRKLQDLFAEALADASTNFNTADISTTTELDTAEVKTTEDGVIMLQQRHYNKKNPVTGKAGRDTLLDYLTERYGSADANSLIETIDNINNVMDEIKRDNPNLQIFSQWQDSEIEIDEEGKPIFTSSINNGDYNLNQDFSRVCKKRRQLDFVLNLLAEDPNFEAKYLTKSDFVAINKAIKKHGFEIACALCFVDSKRFRQAEWADSFANTWNDILDSVMVEGSKPTPFDFATNKVNIADEGIQIDLNKPITLRKWSDGKVDETRHYKNLDQIISEKVNKNGKEVYAEGNSNIRNIARLIKEHPELRHKFRGADIIASKGFDTIQRLAPEIRGILDGWGGSSVPKPSSSDTSYDSSILNIQGYNAEAAFAMGGARMNSFSDFMAHMFFDYCEALADMSAKGLPMQAYTKELDFARLFGTLGGKINMSGIAAIRSNPLPTDAKKGISKAEAEANAEIEKKFAGLDVSRLAEHLQKDVKELTDQDLEQFLDMCDYVWADESIDMKKATLLQSGIMYDRLSETVQEECYELIKHGEFDRAFEVAGKENINKEYAKHIGTIVVGVSDAHIRKLLRDNTVRMVIPYHKSGLNPVIAKALNIAVYNDYTNTQNTGIIKKASKKRVNLSSKEIQDSLGLKDFSFYDYFGKTIDGKLYDGKATADKYLEWCEKGVYDEEVGDYVYYTKKGNGYILASELHKKFTIAPKFDAFTDEINYYKLLEDFDCYDTITGEHSAQEAVKFLQEGLPSDYKAVLTEALKEEQKVQDNFRDHLDNHGLRDEIMDIVEKRGYKAKEGIGIARKVEGLAPNAMRSERDTAYMNAVNNGDMETAQRMVDEAAKKAGYTVKVYHGTSNFGFTKLDVKKSDDKISFFATDDVVIASTYTQGIGTEERAINEKKKKFSRKDVPTLKKQVKDISLEFVKEYSDALGDKKLKIRNLDFITDEDAFNATTPKEVIEYTSEAITAMFAINDNVINARGTKQIENISEDIKQKLNALTERYTKKLDSLISPYHNSGIYGLYANTDNHLVIDAQGSLWRKIKSDKLPYKESGWTTREVAKYAKETGYSGVTFKNLVDPGNAATIQSATVYVFLNPESQLKSADPVTYDAFGRVIPLSKRFNCKNDDIRYSERDSNGNTLTEAQQEYFKDSKVRDADGNLQAVYHGTPTGGFTKFELPHYLSTLTSAQGAGFYFTDERNAKQYTKGLNGKSVTKKQLYKVYLNITNPLEITPYSSGNITDQNMRDIMARGNYKWGMEHVDIEKEIRINKLDSDRLAALVRVFNGSDILEAMKDVLGHDGVRYTDNYGDVWVAWSQEQIKDTTNTNPTSDPDIRYSLREIVGEDGTNYGVGVYLDSNLLTDLTDDERIEMVKEYIKELGGKPFSAFDDNGDKVTFKISEDNKYFINQNGKRTPVNKDLKNKYSKNKTKQEAIALVDELILASSFFNKEPSRYPHGWLDNYGKNDWEYWTTYIQDKENTIWEATLNIATAANGEKILYDINPIKMVGQSVKSDTIPTDDNVPQDTDSVKQNFDILQSARNVKPITETEYKSLEKNFGTTGNFRVAGYLLTDGKLLDFSGKHWGDTTSRTRQVDHRDVSEVLNRGNNGVNDMVDMIGNGNIRLMPEIGGINLAVYPNEKQRRVLSMYINYMLNTEGEVIIDYDAVGGDTVYSKTYGKTATSKQILNDIRNYFNGARQSELMSFHTMYSERNPDSVSNRSLLANALENVAQNDIERSKLQQYKEKIDFINAEEEKLAKLNKELYELRFSKGKRDTIKTKQINDLQAEATKTANRISIYDKQLLRLEATTALKNVLEREKTKAMKRQKQRDAEILQEQKDKANATIINIMNRNTESRKRAVEGRHKTVVRNKIKRVIKDLNSVFNRGTKERNVKIGLRETVRKALEASEVLFSDEITNEDIVRLGVDSVSEQDSEKLERYATLLALRDTKTDAVEISRINSQISRLNSDLKDVFIRERARLNKENVSTALDSLAEAYASLQNSDDDYIKNNAFVQGMHDRIKSLSENLNGVIIKDMSLEQLEDVYKIYSSVRHMIVNANSIFRDGLREDLSKKIMTVQGEILELQKDNRKDPRVIVDAIGNAIKSFDWNNQKPVYAFEKLGSKAFQELFWDAIKAEGLYAQDVKEAGDFIDAQKDKFKYADWDFKKAKTFKSANGLDFKLTLADMMSIYAYSKRPQAFDHMTQGGFTFDRGSEYVDEKGRKRKHVRLTETYTVSIELINEIVRTLSEEQIGYVDAVQAYLTSLGEKGNEVSRTLYGIDLFTEKVYFPLKSDADYRSSVEQALNETQTQVSLKNTGMTKQTVPHANNPIVLQGFDDVVLGHVDNMSKYHSFVLPIENLRRVFDNVSRDENASYDATKVIIESVFGESAKQYFDQYITDLNGGVHIGGYQNIFMDMFSKMKKTAVSASLSVVVQQPFAITRAMDMINPVYFTPVNFNATKKNTDSKSQWEELKKYAPIAIIKEMGGFDVGSSRTTKEYIDSKKSLDDFFMWGASKADEIGWSTIWKAVKREVASQHKELAVGSEAFLKKCGERFTEVVVYTQVYDSVNSRSGMMRSKRDLDKFATSFMGEPTTTINMIENSMLKLARAVKSKDGKAIAKATAKMGRTTGVVLGSILLTSLAKSLVYAGRDDDEEDKALLERWAKHFGDSLTADLNPLTMIPYLRDFVSIWEGWDVERPDMTVVADIVTSIKKAVDEGCDVDEALALIGNAGNAFGLPVKNIIREVQGAINVFGDITDNIEPADIKGAFMEGWTGEEKSTKDSLYQAIINGDESRVAVLRGEYKTEDAYEQAIRKALRENDPRIREAAQARIDGDIAKYSAIVREIKAEGHFVQDTIVAAVNAEINLINKEAKEQNASGNDEIEDTEEKATSIYKASDINAAFDNGDTNTALAIIEDLVSTKVANGMTEKEAKSSVKSSITSYWKPIFLEAYTNKDSAEQKRIRQILLASGLYGKTSEVIDTTQQWIKDSKKKK